MVNSSEHGDASYDRVWTDSNGEFELFPLGDERCTNRNPCLIPDMAPVLPKMVMV